MRTFRDSTIVVLEDGTDFYYEEYQIISPYQVSEN